MISKNDFTHNPPGSVPVVVPVFPGTVDCIEAVQECVLDPECKRPFRHLEYCVDEEAVAPLSLEARQACIDAQNKLMRYQLLQECKCQRGTRIEQQCLRVYWTVRFPQGKGVRESVYLSYGECCQLPGSALNFFSLKILFNSEMFSFHRPPGGCKGGSGGL